MDIHPTTIEAGQIVLQYEQHVSNTFRVDYVDQQANKVVMVGRRVLTPSQENQHARNDDLVVQVSYRCGDDFIRQPEMEAANP